jgi:hypothetical protein
MTVVWGLGLKALLPFHSVVAAVALRSAPHFHFRSSQQYFHRQYRVGHRGTNGALKEYSAIAAAEAAHGVHTPISNAIDVPEGVLKNGEAYR